MTTNDSRIKRAARGAFYVLVPVKETGWVVRALRHMLGQHPRRLKKIREERKRAATDSLTWEQAVTASRMSVETIHKRLRRRLLAWRTLCWTLVPLATLLAGMGLNATALPDITLWRLTTTVLVLLSGAALAASRALIASYRLWQLHERRVSPEEKGTFRDFLEARQGWYMAVTFALTHPHRA